MRVSGLEMLVFREILRTYLMDGPSAYVYIVNFSSLCSKLFIYFGMPFLSSRVVPTNVNPFSFAQIATQTNVKDRSKDMLQLSFLMRALSEFISSAERLFLSLHLPLKSLKDGNAISFNLVLKRISFFRCHR